MSDPYWFTLVPHEIANGLMGFTLEHKKISNLLSLGDGDIEFWNMLAILPKEDRLTLGDEWANFLLGPFATAMNAGKYKFSERGKVIEASGMFMLVEAMKLGLIPPGKRRKLYEDLIERYNGLYWAEAGDIGRSSEEIARVAFYTILADVVAPIFDEASGDELGLMIVKVLADNPKQAETAKDDPKVIGWLMGQVMRASPTKLDPNTVRAAIIERL